MVAKLKIFVAFFSGTTMPGFLKFGFRVYISQLYHLMHFQIHHLTTSCLPKTCIIVHMMTKLKMFLTFFLGTKLQGFLKFGPRVNISQLYRVIVFRFITRQLPVYRTLAYFYTIKIIHLRRGYHL